VEQRAISEARRGRRCSRPRCGVHPSADALDVPVDEASRAVVVPLKSNVPETLVKGSCGIRRLEACDSLTDRMRPATDLFASTARRAGLEWLRGARKLRCLLPPRRDPVAHVLPNGVRVVIQEFAPARSSRFSCGVRAGGRDETASEVGLAHLPRAHALQGNDHPRAEASSTGTSRAFGGRSERRHLGRLHLLPRRASEIARCSHDRDARRYQRQLGSRRNRASTSRRRSCSTRSGSARTARSAISSGSFTRGVRHIPTDARSSERPRSSRRSRAIRCSPSMPLLCSERSRSSSSVP